MPDGSQPDQQHEADAAQDAQLLRDLRVELEREEAVAEGDIHAIVQHAVAIFTGSAPHDGARAAARAAARRVAGIHDVHDDIRVLPGAAGADEDILVRVQTMLGIDAAVAADRLIVMVADGRVTIGGHVEWPAQASAAVAAARRVRGVRDVTSTIHVDGLPSLAAMRARLVIAFRDAGEAAAAGIELAISGKSVRLSGSLKSMADRRLAEATVRTLPGVESVDNRIAID